MTQMGADKLKEKEITGIILILIASHKDARITKKKNLVPSWLCVRHSFCNHQ